MTNNAFQPSTTQLTQEEAIAFFENQKWKSMNTLTRAFFQLQQERLCMPFNIFHEALQEALGRPVFTHEIGLNRDGLLQEMNGLADAPTFDQILSLIPPDKRVVVLPE